MIGWLGIRIMCPSGPTCRHADCCLSELALKNPLDRVELFLILITKNTTCGHIKNV